MILGLKRLSLYLHSKTKPEILMSFVLYLNSLPLTLWPLACFVVFFKFHSISGSSPNAKNLLTFKHKTRQHSYCDCKSRDMRVREDKPMAVTGQGGKSVIPCKRLQFATEEIICSSPCRLASPASLCVVSHSLLRSAAID